MPARNHHYLPQGYLKGFSPNPALRRPQLIAFDLVDRKSFPTSVRNVAAERDFNTVKSETHAPDALENALAEFEGRAYLAIQRIDKSRTLDEWEDRAHVLNLLALIHQRHPERRAKLDKAFERTWKDMIRVIVASPQQYEHMIKKAHPDLAKSGVPSVSYEEMKEFVERDEFDVETSREYHIGLEFEVFDEILPIYFERKWLVLRASEETGGFVTSDRPVRLAWRQAQMSNSPYPPGLAHTQTSILFPLTKTLCLLGVFDGEERAVNLDLAGMALVNSWTIGHAKRQVYAPHYNFWFLANNGKLKSGEDFFKE